MQMEANPRNRVGPMPPRFSYRPPRQRRRPPYRRRNRRRPQAPQPRRLPESPRLPRRTRPKRRPNPAGNPSRFQPPKHPRPQRRKPNPRLRLHRLRPERWSKARPSASERRQHGLRKLHLWDSTAADCSANLSLGPRVRAAPRRCFDMYRKVLIGAASALAFAAFSSPSLALDTLMLPNSLTASTPNSAALSQTPDDK